MTRRLVVLGIAAILAACTPAATPSDQPSSETSGESSSESSSESSGLYTVLRDFQNLIGVLLGGVALKVILQSVGDGRARRDAVSRKRLETLDGLAAIYTKQTIQLRRLIFNARERRLESESGREYQERHNAFIEEFQIECELLRMKAAQYFARGRDYADRLENLAHWCATLSPVAITLSEAGDDVDNAREWNELRDLTTQFTLAYRELFERMTLEVSERRQPAGSAWATSFDAERLERLGADVLTR